MELLVDVNTFKQQVINVLLDQFTIDPLKNNLVTFVKDQVTLIL